MERNSTAILIVDMQNDFASRGGTLYSEASESIIPQIQHILNEGIKRNIPIIFTQDWHRKNDPEFHIWPHHTIENTYGAEIIPEMKVRETDYIVRKRTYNAFFNTDLDMLLRHLKVKNLIIAGTIANICVLNTAGDAALLGYKIILPTDAIAALNEFDHQATLRQVDFLYKGKLTDSKNVFNPEFAISYFHREIPPPGIKRHDKITINSNTAALIVVDMQKDFAHKQGTLYVSGTQDIIEPLDSLISKSRDFKIPVIFTQDWHKSDDIEFSIWPAHTVEATSGAEIIPELNSLSTDYFIKKRTYDAFFGTDLDLLLRQKGIETVIITGTVSNICVLHTGAKARLHGYSVIIPEDVICSLSDFDQYLALRQFDFLYSARITRSSGIIFT